MSSVFCGVFFVLFCLHVCMCTLCVPSAFWGHKRSMDPLELESWVVVILYVGDGNWTQLLCKSNGALSCRATSPATSATHLTLFSLPECQISALSLGMSSSVSSELPRAEGIRKNFICSCEQVLVYKFSRRKTWLQNRDKGLTLRTWF